MQCQKIHISREYECVVTMALHSGNLGHRSYSRDWIVLNIDVLCYFVYIILIIVLEWLRLTVSSIAIALLTAGVNFFF